MKEWFPLTNYDFYAYLAAGMVALAAGDRVFLSSSLASEQNWTIVSGVFWAAISYFVGQIVAIPSSGLLEHFLARRVLRSPSQILLGLEAPRFREKAIAVLFGAREYRPLSEPTRASIIRKISTALGVTTESLNADTAFEFAFPHARGVADTSSRLDTFLNQYGMCRNVSFSAMVAAVLLGYHALATACHVDWVLAGGALVLSIGLFGRFIKFYAAYSREVFRTYDKCAT